MELTNEQVNARDRIDLSVAWKNGASPAGLGLANISVEDRDLATNCGDERDGYYGQALIDFDEWVASGGPQQRGPTPGPEIGGPHQ